MAEDKTGTGRGNDFGEKRTPSRGHDQAASRPIVNAGLTPTNPKRVTVIPHPGVQSGT